MKAELRGNLLVPDDVQVGDMVDVAFTARVVCVKEDLIDTTTMGSRSVPTLTTGERTAAVIVSGRMVYGSEA